VSDTSDTSDTLAFTTRLSGTPSLSSHPFSVSHTFAFAAPFHPQHLQPRLRICLHACMHGWNGRGQRHVACNARRAAACHARTRTPPLELPAVHSGQPERSTRGQHQVGRCRPYAPYTIHAIKHYTPYAPFTLSQDQKTTHHHRTQRQGVPSTHYTRWHARSCRPQHLTVGLLCCHLLPCRAPKTSCPPSHLTPKACAAICCPPSHLRPVLPSVALA
jgi:hypothetical protein